jgi:hypothetical protein
LLKQGDRVSLGAIGVKGGRFLQSETAMHRVCPRFLIVSGKWSTADKIRNRRDWRGSPQLIKTIQ